MSQKERILSPSAWRGSCFAVNFYDESVPCFHLFGV
jgi:hypothetical protein